MKAFHKVNGWLYKCVGGPLDGWDVRMTATESVDPDVLPAETFELTHDRSGSYRLSELVGKTARHSGALYPKYHYVWVADASHSDDHLEVTA